MFDSKIIQHADISQKDLDEIINIKSVAWPYSYKKQVEWININIKDSDSHLLLLSENKVVAYLNLISIELIIDNCNYIGLGVGNVCAIEKGQGYGVELMKKVNQFITRQDYLGLLFCKTSLVNFYIKNNWNIIEKKRLELSFANNNIETMIFNSSLLFNKLTYKGRSY